MRIRPAVAEANFSTVTVIAASHDDRVHFVTGSPYQSRGERQADPRTRAPSTRPSVLIHLKIVSMPCVKRNESRV